MQLSAVQRETLVQVLVALLAQGDGQPKTQPASAAPTPPAPTGPLSLIQIAARHNVSRSLVYQHAKQGKLKTFRVGLTGPMRATPEAEREWAEGCL